MSGAPLFTPDYTAIVLAAKIHTNSNLHSIYIRFLWVQKLDKIHFKEQALVVGTKKADMAGGQTRQSGQLNRFACFSSHYFCGNIYQY
jgi:hypothetical protein